jgi:hypothetical protein
VHKMKIRLIKITPENLIQLFQGMSSPLASNLPADAELVDLKLDLVNNQVLAIIQSDSFEEVTFYPIPEFTQKIAESKIGPKSMASAKIESKPEPKPATVPIVIPKVSIKMENEFSPEQRKVLSFTVKGDVVVIKPIQFLKEEWDDINEVVRSLGGKWVRGDIISYWEIPLQQS